METMEEQHRSGCPINLTLEVLGDRWSLLIIRDIVFGGKRHFRDLLQSEEGIASNMLSDRLKMLVAEGMLTRSGDPNHKQKVIYSLTEKSIALVPVLALIGIWGRTYLPISECTAEQNRAMEAGNPEQWQQLMDRLRAEHMGGPSGIHSHTA